MRKGKVSRCTTCSMKRKSRIPIRALLKSMNKRKHK